MKIKLKILEKEKAIMTCFLKIIITLVFVFFLYPAYTIDIYVPTDYGTIQAAIVAAQDGDTIIVDTGIYYEHIDFLGKAITVTSTNPYDYNTVHATIITGDTSVEGDLVTFANAEGINSRLLGFLLYRHYMQKYGHGIYCYGASPVIEGCYITGNYATSYTKYYGGGIHCSNSSARIINCSIYNNEAGYGGGIYCSNSSPDIINCSISTNTVKRGGGGICCWNNSSPLIQNTYITSNDVVYSTADGGGISCRGNSSPQIIDSTIANNTAGRGGGLYCYYASPSIINTEITQNNGDYHYGGGIYMFRSSIYLFGCRIYGNHADWYGGGIYCISPESSASKIIACSIYSNNSERGGGGIYLDNTSLQFSHCYIANNRAEGSAYAYGGGIYSITGAPVFDKCRIAVNSTSGTGAGFYLSDSNAIITNCIIYKNVVQSTSKNGGGIYCGNSSDAQIINCTIAYNSTQGTGAKGAGMYCTMSSPKIMNTIICGNGPDNFVGGGFPDVSFSDIQGGFTGEGNIDLNPLFVDSAGNNYRLDPSSPCIDAGFNSGAPPDDVEYIHRPIDGNGDTVAICDIGAHEYFFPAGIVYFVNPWESIHTAIGNALNNDIIILYPGVYKEAINFMGKAITVRSTNPWDPDVAADTILDGDNMSTVVTFNQMEGADSVLSGLTIRNGFSSFGGGIFCQDSSPLIELCNIIENRNADMGAGIYCFNASPVISRCHISRNEAMQFGGGIYCEQISNALIINCTVIENFAMEGAGFYCADSDPSIINSTFSMNMAHAVGGAVTYMNSNLNIINSILWANAPDEILAGPGPAVVISFSDILGGVQPGQGNISADPMFRDPVTLDFRVAFASPCVEAGTSSSAPNIDKDGNLRPHDADGDGTAQYDMGAYELHNLAPVVTCPADMKVAGTGPTTPVFYQATAVDDYDPNPVIYYNPPSGTLFPYGMHVVYVQATDSAGKSSYCTFLVEVVTDSTPPTITCPEDIHVENDGTNTTVYFSEPAQATDDYDPQPQINYSHASDSQFPLGINTVTVTATDFSGNSSQCTFLVVVHVPYQIYPGDSIQFAINSAAQRDFIIVHPGTYIESLNFIGKNLTLRSTDPKNINVTRQTILDGNSASTIITFNSGENHHAVVKGLTLQNAFNTSGDGGAVYCMGTSPTFENCLFQYNTAYGKGGGLYSQDGTPKILNTFFYFNVAYGRGGAVYLENSNVEFINVLFQANKSYNEYGGALCIMYSSPLLLNCTITESYSGNPGFTGMPINSGGIYHEDSNATVTNCIFWANNPGDFQVVGTSPVVTYTNISSMSGATNINSDPLFIDAADGDFHLSSNSPCIDTGTNSGAPFDDYDGNYRPADGDYDGQAICDMGVYELIPPPANPNPIILPPSGDATGDGEINILDALVVARYYVGIDVGFEMDLYTADVDLDNQITILDALVIARYYVGIIPSLPLDG